MTHHIIDIGAGPNTKDGTPLRTAMDMINKNFDILFNSSDSTVQSKNIDFTASAYTTYMVDTSLIGVTATLPASPTIGNTIRFVDVSGTFDTNNLTIDRNALPINGAASNTTLSTQFTNIEFFYAGGAIGWITR